MSASLSESQVDQLIADYVDGTISADDLQRFSAWLAEAPENAHRVAQISMTQYTLSEVCRDLNPDYILKHLKEIDRLAGPISPVELASLNQNGLKQSALPAWRDVKQFVRSPWAYGSLAALLFLAVGLIAVWQLVLVGSAPSAPPDPFAVTPNEYEGFDLLHVAKLTAEHDAVWEVKEGTTKPVVGSLIYPGQAFTLSEGFAEITTWRGAKAILQAPCTVSFSEDDNALKLQDGKLVGVCETSASRGFAVVTEYARVVDLGTVFGVAHIDGKTDTSVFEGEVTVAPTDQSAAQSHAVSLRPGDTARVDAAAQVKMIDTVFADTFVRDWSAMSEPKLSGDIHYERSFPRSLGLHAYEHEQILLFHEQSDKMLDESVRVTLTEPGSYDDIQSEQPKPLGRIQVDCYLIHYDFKQGGDPDVPLRATIHFDRPIVGVIADEAGLFASDAALGVAGVLYPEAETPEESIGRGLERSHGKASDIIEISDDRRTLTIELVSKFAVDQARVLVQSRGNVQEPTTP